MDSKKIIVPQVPKIEEVREIEETKLEVPQVEKVEVPKETSTPDKDEQIEENLKRGIGGGIGLTTAAAPPIGAAEAGIAEVGGEITEGIGKITDDEGTEAAGRVLKEAPNQPIKEIGKGIKKIFE